MSFLGFGGPPKLDQGPANQYMGYLNSLGTKLGSGYDAASANYGSDNANYNDALKSYSDYLKSNPATSQYNTTQVANAERGASEGAQRATANTESDLASRGISMNSGIGAGALANVNEGLAANNANIQNAVGQNNIAQHDANMGKLADLWGGAQSNAFGQANTLAGQQANIYGNLFSDADQLALQKYNGQQQNQLGQQQFLTGLAGAAAAF